jgi:hypothetical protein
MHIHARRMRGIDSRGAMYAWRGRKHHDVEPGAWPHQGWLMLAVALLLLWGSGR